MRSLSVLQEVFVPHVSSIITQLTQKLMLVSKVRGRLRYTLLYYTVFGFNLSLVIVVTYTIIINQVLNCRCGVKYFPSFHLIYVYD